MNDELPLTAPRSARDLSAHKEQLRAFEARKEIMEALQAHVRAGHPKPTEVRLDVQRFTAAEQLASLTEGGPLLLGMRLVQDDEAEGGLAFA